MKIIKVLESKEVTNPVGYSQETERLEFIERLIFWEKEFLDSGFSCKLIREGVYWHIVLVKRRKTRSDAGKERVNRTGYRRGMNPLPRNLDKIPIFIKKD